MSHPVYLHGPLQMFGPEINGVCNYSGTPLYGHPLNADTPVLRTVSLVPAKTSSYGHPLIRTTDTFPCPE